MSFLFKSESRCGVNALSDVEHLGLRRPPRTNLVVKPNAWFPELIH
jgi:hypothetical protein